MSCRDRQALRRALCVVALGSLVLTAAVVPRSGSAQTPSPHDPVWRSVPSSPLGRAAPNASAHDDAPLDSLVARAVAVSPQLRAVRSRVDAARARVGPAGSLPDPMLMAGVQNLPLGKETITTTSAHGGAATSLSRDPMTMHIVGLGQTMPYPGKLALRRRVAEREVDVARAQLDAATRQLVRDVKDAYYDLVFLDQSIVIVRRNADVLGAFIRVTEARYGTGSAGQQDVLKARVEATRLAETATSLGEQRRAALARLNALLDRPSETTLEHAILPEKVARAAAGDSSRDVRFVSAALGARASDSPLPPLVDVQASAVRESPEIREHEAMIASQAARVEAARKDVLPDFDVSVQYGQRTGFVDMVTATVSVPLPVFRHRKQDQVVAEASATLAALHAEHVAKLNQIRADVARLVSELERARTQLALYAKGVLPQARATLTSATSSYQVGKVEFLTVLDDQATVFAYETEYFRALTNFAKNLAELERIAGKEIIR